MRIKFIRTVVAPIGDGTAHLGEVHEVDDTLAHDLIGQGSAEPSEEPLTFPTPVPKTKKKATTHATPKGKKKK